MMQAVEKLASWSQGEEEFWAEVSTNGTIYHMNLVRMWGYCSEAAHELLVHEYVENGSLAKHLFTNTDATNFAWIGTKVQNCSGHCRGVGISPRGVFGVGHSL